MMGQSFDTKSVHVSMRREDGFPTKVTPIHQTSAFTFKDLEDIESFYEGDRPYLYTRVGNPNTDELGQAVASLEGAEDGIATSSGLSAIMVGILAAVEPGQHILASRDIYGGTLELLTKELTNFGIEVSLVDFEQDIEKHMKDNTVLLYSETITNPLLRVENLDRLIRIAKKHQLLTMVDNTFATPYLIQPYKKGVDLVVHSATKYLGGHSDITAGVLIGHASMIEKARTKCVNLGANLSPFEAWLTVRGIKTLAVRMERHVKNAAQLAEELKNHQAISKVYYPSFVSDKGNGAIVTIELSDKADMNQFFKQLDWVKIVATLAGVETSVSYPAGTSHRNIDKSEREKLGVTDKVVRISVGIEDGHDIVTAFQHALEQSIK